MLRIPNYNVVVPVTPDIRLIAPKRVDYAGDRDEKRYTYSARDTIFIQLPWVPTSADWVEVYVDNIRLINPRVTNKIAGTLYEVYNISGSGVINFTRPITGEVTVLCDTKAAHWYASTLIHPKNVQAYFKYINFHDFKFDDWKIIGGSINGLTYRVYYEPGPTFQANSYVIINKCKPDNFNGNFQVLASTPESVTFRGNVAAQAGTAMKIPGKITGFGNGVIKESFGVALYAEPVIITQPYHGYARLTTDRKGIAYVPDYNYTGNDTFSWALINQHGQIGDPKCVSIRVLQNI